MSSESGAASVANRPGASAIAPPNRLALAIFAIALLMGAGLRLYRLGADELSRGEAAAWAAAAAPTAAGVITAGRRIDPGKLALYDVALHGWMALFGDGAGAMRLLSALLGTLSIVLIFAAVREIMRGLDAGADSRTAEFAGAFAALLFAGNLQMTTWDRTARMYAPMLTAMLAQLYFFVRTHRRAGAANCVAAAFFTVVAIACNYTALFFFPAEGLWLAWLMTFGRDHARRAGISIARPLLALAGAGLVVLPLGALTGGVETGALHGGALEWIEPQPPWWPLRALMVLTGNAAFWPMAGLAIFGVWRQRTRAAHAIGFILCWMAVPFAIDMLVSYAIAPLMVERYVLAGLAAFIVLAGVGLASIEWRPARYALALLVVGQSLAHIHHHWRAPEDIQWREAIASATAALPGNAKAIVMPPGEPLYVINYYLPPAARGLVIGGDATYDGTARAWRFRCGPQPVAIVQLELPRDLRGEIAACYPRRIAGFRKIEVRGR